MSEASRLKALLDLVDDPSENIRNAILSEMDLYGDDLEEAYAQLENPPDATARRAIRRELASFRTERLRREWLALLQLEKNIMMLEQAYRLIAEFRNGRNAGKRLAELLNGHAQEYSRHHNISDAFRLARHLFRKEDFKGAHANYYDPRNSDLFSVLTRKEGIPISLVSLYMLVGHRLGLPIEGCNLPGHFLARVRHNNSIYFVDCYHGGEFFQEHDFMNTGFFPTRDLTRVLRTPAPIESIISRVLRNLINAYLAGEDSKNGNLMMELLDRMERNSIE